MTLVEECLLAHSSSFMLSSHVIDWLSPSILLRGGQWSTCLCLGQFHIQASLPAAVSLYLLIITLWECVSFNLIVDVQFLLSLLFLHGVSKLSLWWLEVMKICVLVHQLVLQGFVLGLSLLFCWLLLLDENLSAKIQCSPHSLSGLPRVRTSRGSLSSELCNSWEMPYSSRAVRFQSIECLRSTNG